MIEQFLPSASDLASFGAAGLMGALWVWERRLSRTREAQLTQAHERLMQERGLMRLVADLVRRNTTALTGLREAQHQLFHFLSEGRAQPPADAARGH